MKRQAIEDALTYALLGIIAVGGVLNIVSYATPGYQTLRYLRARVRLERAGKITRVPEATVDAEIARSATMSARENCVTCGAPITRCMAADGLPYWMHVAKNGGQYTYCLHGHGSGFRKATPV